MQPQPRNGGATGEGPSSPATGTLSIGPLRYTRGVREPHDDKHGYPVYGARMHELGVESAPFPGPAHG